MKTAGRWPWKSETAKECVTTHLPNGAASKMDGARNVPDRNRCPTVSGKLRIREKAMTCRRARDIVAEKPRA